ncbi:MAG: hypothetical protein ISP62_04135 [Cryomorphaceae bacterium]|nr:hypothetical protein [Cryomorphaceae bacterium]
MLLNLDLFSNENLYEYEIELILIKNLDANTNEAFNKEFMPPASDVLNFYNPKLQLNALSYASEPNINFFNKLFENLKPVKKQNSSEDDQINKSIPNPKTWYRPTDNLIILNKLKNKLSSNSKYKVIGSYRWIQNIESKDNAKYLFNEDLDNQFGFYIKFYRSRFMHIAFKSYLGVIDSDINNITELKIKDYENLILKKNSDKNETNIEKINISLNKENLFIDITNKAISSNINTVNTGPIKLFIDEEKRIFNEEIHYFDHPYFGAIVSIKKI